MGQMLLNGRVAAGIFLGCLAASEFLRLPEEVRAEFPQIASTMPDPGTPSKSPGSFENEFPGSPIFDGSSFDALGEVLNALLKPGSNSTRGAREIEIFRVAAPAVVLIRTGTGSGSGVILSNGLILTNRHVVEGFGAVQIFFKPNSSVNETEAAVRSGTVKCVDPSRDLALIQVDAFPPNSKYLNISSKQEFDVGDDVFAIGHPLGYTWTFTQGIISGVRRIDNNTQHYTAIQTQTPINPGNSGGPLLNSAGEVVGINTWMLESVDSTKIDGKDVALTRPSQGLNFAVSAPDLLGFVNDYISGRLTTLALKIPSKPGCTGQVIFDGRTKSEDANLKIFSLQCDAKADAWEIIPDDKAKPTQLNLDPDRTGAASIVVFSNPDTGKWETSLWHFYRDSTFAVKGLHETGKIQPTRFVFVRG